MPKNALFFDKIEKIAKF